MTKINELLPVFLEELPQKKESGILYISEKYEIAIHLCACGCGIETVTPLGDGEWSLSKNEDKVTLRPSIGNFTHEAPNYHAHYYITDNRIDWL